MFSFSQISNSPERVQYFTGLPDVATVLFLESLLSKFELQYHSDWTVQIMPLVDQLLLTLMKLRLNCGHIDLATRFNCSTATVTNILTTIISAQHPRYANLLKETNHKKGQFCSTIGNTVSFKNILTFCSALSKCTAFSRHLSISAYNKYIYRKQLTFS